MTDERKAAKRETDKIQKTSHFDYEQQILSGHYKEIRAEEQQTEEYKLDLAVRLGLEKANRTRRRARSSRVHRRIGYGALTAVLLTSLAALLIVGPNSSMAPNGSQQGSTSPLTFIDPVASMDPALQPPDYVMEQIDSHKDWKKALEHGLYQPINQTQEKEGYKVTVDGVLADSRAAIVFYTTENQQTKAPISLLNPTMLNDPSPPSWLSPYQSESTAKDSPVLHGRAELYYLASLKGQTPSTFKFGGYWGNSSLPEKDKILIEFQLQINTHKELTKTIMMNKPIHIDKYKFIVKNTVIGPLVSIVNIDLGNSSNQMEDLYAAQLNVGAGDQQAHLNGFTNPPNVKRIDSPGLQSFFFTGGLFEKDTSTVTFSAKGIEEKSVLSQQITINTDTKQIINPPDNRLKMDNLFKRDGQIFISLSLKPSLNGKVNYMKYSFDLKQNFKDAAGNEFTFKTPSQTSLSEDGAANQVTFGLEDRSYKQPLTFTVPFYHGGLYESPIMAIGKEETQK